MSVTRAILFLVLGYVALLVEGALGFVLPGPRLLIAVPELALAVVTYLGLSGRGGAAGLTAMALTLGYLRDLFLGSPRGVEALTFAVVALLARAMHGRVFLERFGQLAAVSVLVSLVHGLLIVLLGSGETPTLESLRPIPGLLLAALSIGPLALRILRRVDRRVEPESRAIRLDGDVGGAWR